MSDENNRYIILLMQKYDDVENLFADDLILVNENFLPKIFNSMDEADTYRQVNQIDGQIVPIPIY